MSRSQRRRGLAAALLGLGLALMAGLAGCGKKGSPEPPPGPVTYPRTYPAD